MSINCPILFSFNQYIWYINIMSVVSLANKISNISTLNIPNMLIKGYVSIPQIKIDYEGRNTKQELKEGKKVKKLLKEKGVKFFNHTFPGEEHNTFSANHINDISDFKNILSGKKASKSAETYAHEYGHIQNNQSIYDTFGKPGLHADSFIYNLGKVGSGVCTALSTLAALTGFDSDTVRNIGLIGMASSTPVLLEEGLASYRGNKFLKENNIKHNPWSTWKGVPTYAIGCALAPMLPWLGKKIYDSVQ